ncbi:MAG: BACON domain-containing protein [Bacteroidales bacterium]|nr:BACON domain-containing protein [Bacteroidales bacterium]
MKKILFALMVAAAVIAVGSCKQIPEDNPNPQDTIVFEIDDLEALPAQAGTFSVGVNANIPFTVEVPDDVNWLRYIETKAEAPEVISAPATKKQVVFEIDLNEADAMRQARVKFLDDKGEQLKALTIIQKAGGGIEFEVVNPEDVSVDGATITLEVTSNVPYEAKPEVDWITVKNVTLTSTEIEIASNGTVDPRDGKVNFYREGTENLIGFVDIHQMEPNVILSTVEGKLGFATVAAAMEAYNALEAGPAEMILAKGKHDGNIAIAEGKVPLTINGNGVATLNGPIEIAKVAVTVKALTVAPVGGITPQFSTSYNYEHGIFVHFAGHGLRLENVTIDMSGLASDATGIFLLAEGENTTGNQTDVIKNCVVDGASGGHRLIQAYGAKVNITGSTFKNPYSSYAVRFGNKGGQILLASNIFEGNAACAVHFNSLEQTSITLGNGTKDNNKFTGTFESDYKANSDVTAPSFSNTFAPPVSYDGGKISVIVDPNAPATLERVWGYYNGSKGEWDDEFIASNSNENWNRNGIISGDYVYVPICGNDDQHYGVAVFDLMTGAYIRTITTGFTKEGRFWTCGIVKMQGDEEDVIYVSNMAMSSEGNPQDLVVYRMVEPDSEGVPTAAQVAMRYTVPTGDRYGDKMTTLGTDEDGLLMFVSFYPNKDVHPYRQEVEFRITGGVVESTPDNFSNALADAGGNITGGIYVLLTTGGGPSPTGSSITRQAIYGTNTEMRFAVGWWWGDTLDQWYNCKIDDSKSWDETPGSLFTNVGHYDDCCLDPHIFWVDGMRYLAYTVVKLDADSHASGYLRIVRIPDADGTSPYVLLNQLWAVRENDMAFQRYPIGDPDDFLAVGHESTNKTGYCDIAYRGDDVYVLSGVTSCGMSVFKVE